MTRKKQTSRRPGRSARRAARRAELRGRRFTIEQKQHAVLLVASGGMTREGIATTVGTTTESLRRWVDAAKASGTMPTPPVAQEEKRLPRGRAPRTSLRLTSAEARRSPYAPADPSQGLGEHEVAAILELKRSHPSMGPAQIRAQLKRFKGWRVSLKAIARVLRGHGYEPVHRGTRPQGPEPTRFEAPRRNALWQADFTEVRVGGERLHVLVILDDFSRYIVGHALADTPSSAVATTTLRSAIARHGKPEAVRTDRGGSFIAFTKETDFGRYLEAELIDHIVGKSYRPRGGGKVESAMGTLKRELWHIEHFEDRAHAAHRLCAFFDEYNERRAHMGIDGLTPADRFFGRADRVLAQIDAVSRGRQGAQLLVAPPGGPVEEIGTAHGGAPLEVLRLLIVDGTMELRFCGARVRLGRIEA